MTLRREPPRRGVSAAVLAVALLLCTAAWAAACATTEPQMFSDGDCVAGGCPQTATSSVSSSSSGGVCTDAGCPTWGADVFSAILDTPGGCTSMGTGIGCHGAGAGSIQLTPGDAAGAYTTLMGYTITMGGPKYIIPCDPEGSGFTCNMVVAMGVTDPYVPACGFPMPSGTGATPLTLAQLTTIATWIQCGAPDN